MWKSSRKNSHSPASLIPTTNKNGTCEKGKTKRDLRYRRRFLTFPKAHVLAVRTQFPCRRNMKTKLCRAADTFLFPTGLLCSKIHVRLVSFLGEKEHSIGALELSGKWALHFYVGRLAFRTIKIPRLVFLFLCRNLDFILGGREFYVNDLTLLLRIGQIKVTMVSQK